MTDSDHMCKTPFFKAISFLQPSEGQQHKKILLLFHRLCYYLHLRST